VGSNNQVMWASGCDFYGNDITNGQVASAGNDCGGICSADPNCDHFSWNGNVCYKKSSNNPVPRNFAGAGNCGYVISRPISTGIENPLDNLLMDVLKFGSIICFK
jgi:hypothetical protein